MKATLDCTPLSEALQAAREWLAVAEQRRDKEPWSRLAEREVLLARQALARVQQRLETEAGQGRLFAEEER